ncbi:MAG: alkaline phosphatase [Bifidobacteriaceae bacterium]|nr:alkaline phosphatase [Bifidobacteriaceae bacterium]
MTNTSIRRKLMAGVSIVAMGAMLFSGAGIANATETPDINTLIQHGGAQRIANTPASGKATNVILFIGDGMGDSEITVARDYLYGPGGTLEGIDKIGQPGATDATETGVGQYTTYATGDGSTRTKQITAVTDSAASGSAWATGTKTYNNAVSVNNDYQPQMNLIELAKAKGLATGNVTTAEIQDATPAVMESHSTQRSCYGPEGKTDGSSNDAANRCDAEQLLENGGIGSISEQLLDTRADVTLGGGNKYFSQVAQAGEWKGKTLKEQAQERGYQYFEDPSQLANVTEANQDSPVLGLFSSGNMPTQYNASTAYDYDTAQKMALAGQSDGNQSLVTCEPNSDWLGNKGASLADMTSKAIDLLSANKNGYFLQVEGASIDKQDHNANACGQIGETDDLDQAIAATLKKVDLTNTLIIVTADHAHTSQIVSWPSYYGLTTPLRAKDGSALYVFYGTSSSQIGNGGSMSHTGTQLRIAASGPGASRVDGLTDQTDNFYTIAKTLGLASDTDEINALSDGAAASELTRDTEAKTATVNLSGFNGDASVRYTLADTTDPNATSTVAQTNCGTDALAAVCGVRIRTTQNTPLVFDSSALQAGHKYTLTVTGQQSGKVVTVDYTIPDGSGASDKTDGTVVVPAETPEADAAVSNAADGKLAKTGVAVAALAAVAILIAGIAMMLRKKAADLD